MKLSEYLKSLIGKEITQENVNSISAEVDGIKDRAVGKVKDEITTLKATHKDTQEALSKYTSIEKESTLKNAFVKAGGKEDKFDSFKKVAGEIEDVEKYDFKETFNEFTSLTEEKVASHQADITSFSQEENINLDDIVDLQVG